MIIHKYVIESPEQVLTVPTGTEILHVGVQGERHCVWVACDLARDLVNRTILFRGTGEDVPMGALHIGTIVSKGMVWHYFDGGES